MANFTPSLYQQNVFEWVTSGKGHGVIKAVPGSGKSTTLLQASLLLKTDKAVFLAFNKAIEVELNEKLIQMGSSMKAQTINAFGFSALRAFGKKFKLDGNKYRSLCKDYLQSERIESYSAYEYTRLQKLVKLVSLVRMTLIDVNSEEAIWGLCQYYDIEFDRAYEKEEWACIWKGVKKLLAAGEQQAKELGIIDFDDQVYLPIVWNLTPEKKDWIFVDESQDLNAARLELIIRSVNGTGRLLFVGDECQSIYGFSGADTQSMNKIIERTGARVMPLSICYRCPTSHIELCASIFPGLEASPTAPEGIVSYIKTTSFYEMVHPGDLVLCRLNAPLVSKCLELIRNGVRAKVRGSDIGTNFVNTLKKIQKVHPHMDTENFIEFINGYRDEQAVLIGMDDDSEMKLAALDDRIDTMKALYYGYCEAQVEQSMEDFYVYIQEFFSDEKGALVILSTVHKAKGLEENRVFILEPEKMPHPKAKPGWQMEQELNIKYVAFSRAKFDSEHVGELYLVSDLLTLEPEEETALDTKEVVEQAVEILHDALETSPEPQEAAQAVETAHDTTETAKRSYGGRKRLNNDDKVIQVSSRFDPSVAKALRAFVSELAQDEDFHDILPEAGKEPAISDVLEQALLSFAPFAGFFAGSQLEAEYQDRRARLKPGHEAYMKEKAGK